jgi:hypothetical protein
MRTSGRRRLDAGLPVGQWCFGEVPRRLDGVALNAFLTLNCGIGGE